MDPGRPGWGRPASAGRGWRPLPSSALCPGGHGAEAVPYICSMPRRAWGGGRCLHVLYAPAGTGRRLFPTFALRPGGPMPRRACALCPCVHAHYAPACMRAMPRRARGGGCYLILLKVGPAPAPQTPGDRHMLGCARNHYVSCVFAQRAQILHFVVV